VAAVVRSAGQSANQLINLALLLSFGRENRFSRKYRSFLIRQKKKITKNLAQS
jgi:hypothetical protein